MLLKDTVKQSQIIPSNYHLLTFPKRNCDNGTIYGIIIYNNINVLKISRNCDNGTIYSIII